VIWLEGINDLAQVFAEHRADQLDFIDNLNQIMFHDGDPEFYFGDWVYGASKIVFWDYSNKWVIKLIDDIADEINIDHEIMLPLYATKLPNKIVMTPEDKPQIYAYIGIQQKVQSLEELLEETTGEVGYEDFLEVDNQFVPCSKQFYEALINFYGAASLQEFYYTWKKEYPKCNMDLHNGNVGFLDGQPVLFDI